MRLLLDTSAFIWLINRSSHLSSKASQHFLESEEAFLSLVSVCELAIKYAKGTLPLPDPPEVLVPLACAQHGIEIMPLHVEAIYALSALPSLHKDPFDRLLVAEAITQGLTILTQDRMIRQYPIPTLW